MDDLYEGGLFSGIKSKILMELPFADKVEMCRKSIEILLLEMKDKWGSKITNRFISDYGLEKHGFEKVYDISTQQ